MTVGARGCGLITDCKRFAHTPSNFRCHKRLRSTSIVFDAGPMKLTNEKDVTLRWSILLAVCKGERVQIWTRSMSLGSTQQSNGSGKPRTISAGTWGAASRLISLLLPSDPDHKCHITALSNSGSYHPNGSSTPVLTQPANPTIPLPPPPQTQLPSPLKLITTNLPSPSILLIPNSFS